MNHEPCAPSHVNYGDLGPWTLNLGPFALCILSFALCILLAGCGGCHPAAPNATRDKAGPDVSERYGEEMLANAIHNLDHFDEYGAGDMQPQILERLAEGSRAEAERSAAPFDPLLTSWPDPEMLRHIVDQLNHWIRMEPPSADWKADPMTAALAKPILELPQMKDLGRMQFSRRDGYALQEAAWLRNISRWARGDFLDDLQRACSLFDWTVRNVQLERSPPDRIPRLPWETLLAGRGTVEERAWLFILLLRQSNIDAAVLAFDGKSETGEGKGERGERKAVKGEKPNTPELQSGGKKQGKVAAESNGKRGANAKLSLRPWCVGVLVDKDVYLFDPLLGLPIPAPGGVTRRPNGLTIRPATLAQCRKDDKLLRRMDLDPSRPYGVRAADLVRVTAMLAASPSELSQRVERLESRLAGDQKIVLTAFPTAAAERWKAAAGIAAARLWDRPFGTLLMREHLSRHAALTHLATMMPFYVRSAALYRGRMLYFKGKFVGENGAMPYYLQARPSNEELLKSSADPLEKLMDVRARQNATYWCGLTACQRGKYDDAVDYFTHRMLQDSRLQESLYGYSDNPWTIGAQYNLARAYEAAGETQRAVLQYGTNALSPGYHGDLLRAKWLEELKVEGGTGKAEEGK
jgi:hypothetical protein